MSVLTSYENHSDCSWTFFIWPPDMYFNSVFSSCLIMTITKFLNLIGCQRVYFSIIFTGRACHTTNVKWTWCTVVGQLHLAGFPLRLNHRRDKNKNFPWTWVVSLAIDFELLESTFISVDFGGFRNWNSLYIMKDFLSLVLRYLSSSRGMNKY